MSKIEMLRLLINQRLTAAAEEIFGVFGSTIAEYEEEISRSKLELERQRRLLELSRKPQVSVQVPGTDCDSLEIRAIKDPTATERNCTATRIKQVEIGEEVKWKLQPPESPM